jgi:hypothetical protein
MDHDDGSDDAAISDPAVAALSLVKFLGVTDIQSFNFHRGAQIPPPATKL